MTLTNKQLASLGYQLQKLNTIARRLNKMVLF